ncbi:Sog2p SCDLUD_003364 [Saccharomycodes ludwigii]|uniref:Sog2p n=1 Tax=Saccharomycodes ludwigii TaxID=36035 RepID=UPI001E8A9ED2|nr:hypothetical protein SCDLUD_003364 [Saccharomycodes ludwigii]KAH3900387.1 hypothetical protein SCDLUD_003364 [Saccharomycodes ludwigii]
MDSLRTGIESNSASSNQQQQHVIQYNQSTNNNVLTGNISESTLAKQKLIQYVSKELNNDTVIRLSHLDLNFLPEEAVDLIINNPTQVDKLYMQKNLLSTLPLNFNKLMHLRLLDLKENKFTTIPAKSLPPSLEILDISFNRIDDLPKYLHKYLPNLKYLNLKENNIKNVNILQPLISLEKLRILELDDDKEQDLELVKEMELYPEDTVKALKKYFEKQQQQQQQQQQSQLTKASRRMGIVYNDDPNSSDSSTPISSRSKQLQSTAINTNSNENFLDNHSKYNDYFKRLSVLPEEVNENYLNSSSEDISLDESDGLISYNQQESTSVTTSASSMKYSKLHKSPHHFHNKHHNHLSNHVTNPSPLNHHEHYYQNTHHNVSEKHISRNNSGTVVGTSSFPHVINKNSEKKDTNNNNTANVVTGVAGNSSNVNTTSIQHKSISSLLPTSSTSTPNLLLHNNLAMVNNNNGTSTNSPHHSHHNNNVYQSQSTRPANDASLMPQLHNTISASGSSLNTLASTTNYNIKRKPYKKLDVFNTMVNDGISAAAATTIDTTTTNSSNSSVNILSSTLPPNTPNHLSKGNTAPSNINITSKKLPKLTTGEIKNIKYERLVLGCRKLLFTFTECQQTIRRITSFAKDKTVAMNVVSLLYGVRSHIDNLVEVLEIAETHFDAVHPSVLIQSCTVIIPIFKQIFHLLSNNFNSFFQSNDICFIRMFYAIILCAYTEMYNAYNLVCTTSKERQQSFSRRSAANNASVNNNNNYHTGIVNSSANDNKHLMERPQRNVSQRKASLTQGSMPQQSQLQQQQFIKRGLRSSSISSVINANPSNNIAATNTSNTPSTNNVNSIPLSVTRTNNSTSSVSSTASVASLNIATATNFNNSLPSLSTVGNNNANITVTNPSNDSSTISMPNNSNTSSTTNVINNPTGLFTVPPSLSHKGSSTSQLGVRSRSNTLQQRYTPPKLSTTPITNVMINSNTHGSNNIGNNSANTSTSIIADASPSSSMQKNMAVESNSNNNSSGSSSSSSSSSNSNNNNNITIDSANDNIVNAKNTDTEDTEQEQYTTGVNNNEAEIDLQLYKILQSVISMTNIVHSQLNTAISKAAMEHAKQQSGGKNTDLGTNSNTSFSGLASKLKVLTSTCVGCMELSANLKNRLAVLLDVGNGLEQDKELLSAGEKRKTWEIINMFLKSIISLLANAKSIMKDIPELDNLRPNLANLAKITKEVTVILDCSSYKTVGNKSNTNGSVNNDSSQCQWTIGNTPISTPSLASSNTVNPFDQLY